MREQTIDEKKKCPRCQIVENQIKKGFNRSGTQRCKCKKCGLSYTMDPKKHAYSEAERQHAKKMYFSGVSGRGVGKIMGMNKSNVYDWIKKLYSCG